MPPEILPGSEKHFGLPGYSLTRTQYKHFQTLPAAKQFSVENRTQISPNKPFHVSVRIYTDLGLLQKCILETMLYELNQLATQHPLREITKLHTCASHIAKHDKNYYTTIRLIDSLNAAISAIREPNETNTKHLLAVSQQPTTHGSPNRRLRTLGLCLAALGAALVMVFGIMLAFSLLPLPTAAVTFGVGLGGITMGGVALISGIRLFEKNRQQSISSCLTQLAGHLPKVNARRSRNLAVLGVSS